MRKTSAQGSRLSEAKYINKSLSALGNVINALTQNQMQLQRASSAGEEGGAVKTQIHVPFRDSKLTRLLQGSLAGNAKTVLVLTISSAAENMMETIATLRFGERAKKLKTAPKINTEKTDLSLKKALSRAEKQLLVLHATIEELRRECLIKDSQIEKYKHLTPNTAACSPSTVGKCERCIWLSEEVERLSRALQVSGANSVEATSQQMISPPRPPVMSPQEIKKQFSDKMLSLLGPEEAEEVDRPVGYEDTRCGVCGLNERETSILNDDTGEYLGGYFTCDGNCGNSFHVRCAGEVGEGGQYVVPSGEWFCTACSVADDATNDVVMSTGPLSPGLGCGGGVESMSEEQKDHQIARLQAEYHAMRRERNRVLNQWQHEKRLASKSAEYRDLREKELDEELVAAKDIIAKLQDDVLKGYTEQNRLKQLLEDMVTAQKQKQKALDVEFQPVLDRSRARGGRRNRYKEESPADSPTQDDPPDSPVHEISGGESQRHALKQHSTASTSSIVSGAMMTRYSSQTGISASTTANTLDEIPKPWLKKSTSRVGSRIEDSSAKELSNTASAPTRLSTSPIRRSRSGRYLNKTDEETEQSYDEVQPLNMDIIGAVSDDGLGGAAASAPGGRRSPFNNRLKNLLKSVKEETGSFVEIRKKYKERETERMMLKSRQKGSRGGGDAKSVSLSSSLPAIL